MYSLTADRCPNCHRFYTALMAWCSFALSLWSHPAESTTIVRQSPLSKILKCKRSIFDWMKCCLALSEDQSSRRQDFSSWLLSLHVPLTLQDLITWDLWSRDLLSPHQHWASLFVNVLLGSYFPLFCPDKSLILRKQEMLSKHLWIHWPIVKGAVGWCQELESSRNWGLGGVFGYGRKEIALASIPRWWESGQSVLCSEKCGVRVKR